MRHIGKSASNIELTNDMIHRTRSAHTKYKAVLEEQEKERELKAQKNKSAEEKAVQYAKEDEEKAQKEREAKQTNDKLEAQDKELHGEEENLYGFLKTAEALVSEADDKLKKSIIYRI